MSKSNSINKNTAAKGVSTMNVQGSPLRLGVNPNKGIPASGNITGARGGMPGVAPANGGKTRVLNSHISQPGSGHHTGESRRSSTTGYGRKGD